MIKRMGFYETWHGNVSVKLMLFAGIVLLTSAYMAKQLYFM